MGPAVPLPWELRVRGSSSTRKAECTSRRGPRYPPCPAEAFYKGREADRKTFDELRFLGKGMPGDTNLRADRKPW